MLVMTPNRAYALAIGLSSFLLFLVQPLISQAILPWFGGGTIVWSTALVFFQLLLLIGYVYAHVLTRLAVKTQVGVHGVLMVAALLSLPILPDLALKPFPNAEPTSGVLWVLLLSVGLPYALLSTTTPLLQAWFSRLPSTDSPYKFYALSNAASLIALFSYPFILQPLLGLLGQSEVFTIIFVATVFALAQATWLFYKQHTAIQTVETMDKPRLSDAVRWTIYAATGSALFMAVSNQLTLDIAPTPFLWIFPLAIYLLSFVFVFSKDLWYDQTVTAALFAFTLFVSLLTTTKSGLPTSILVTPMLVMLFFGCLLVHGQLAQSKPKPSGLTLYYFFLSLGGVLGGGFVALLAPRIFTGYWELPITEGITLAIAMASTVFSRCSAYWIGRRPATAIASLSLVIGIVHVQVVQINSFFNNTIFVDRTPYGVLRVKEHGLNTNDHFRELLNGSTTHGDQYLSEEFRGEATSYYGISSGIGRLMNTFNVETPRHLGVIGLGAGTMAVYGDENDLVSFYEIDPVVEQVAREQFSYLPRALSQVAVHIGDARLSLESAEPQGFDVLVIDAFSSDAIPVHLLTAEAFTEYARHLAPNGMIAVHVSNRHLDLTPVVAAGAEQLGMGWRELNTNTITEHESGNTWVLVSADEEKLEVLEPKQNETTAVTPWSDSYSSLLPLLRL